VFTIKGATALRWSARAWLLEALPCKAERRSVKRTAKLCSDAAHSCRKRPVIVHVWRNLSPAA
jgi:hypothetical protein